MTDEHWTQQIEIPEDLKTNQNLLKYKSLEDALRGNIEAVSKLGRSTVHPLDDSDPAEMQAYYEKLQKTANGKLIIHPDSIDTDEQKAAYYKMLGVPDEATGYELSEGVELDSNVLNGIRSMAFDSKWTPRQFKEATERVASQTKEAQQEFTKAQEADKGVIAAKFGDAEPGKLAEIKTLIAEKQDPNHPVGEMDAASLLMLDNILNDYRGKGPQSFKQPTESTGLTPDEQREKLDKLTNKLITEGPTMERTQYKRLMEQKLALTERIYG